MEGWRNAGGVELKRGEEGRRENERKQRVIEGRRDVERNEDEQQRVNIQRMECGSVRCAGVNQVQNEYRRG